MNIWKTDTDTSKIYCTLETCRSHFDYGSIHFICYATKKLNTYNLGADKVYSDFAYEAPLCKI